jgi:hypothetical protein
LFNKKHRRLEQFSHSGYFCFGEKKKKAEKQPWGCPPPPPKKKKKKQKTKQNKKQKNKKGGLMLPVAVEGKRTKSRVKK